MRSPPGGKTDGHRLQRGGRAAAPEWLGWTRRRKGGAACRRTRQLPDPEHSSSICTEVANASAAPARAAARPPRPEEDIQTAWKGFQSPSARNGPRVATDPRRRRAALERGSPHVWNALLRVCCRASNARLTAGGGCGPKSLPHPGGWRNDGHILTSSASLACTSAPKTAPQDAEAGEVRAQDLTPTDIEILTRGLHRTLPGLDPLGVRVKQPR